MASVSENYLQSSIKVEADVSGETISGSGFIYATSTMSRYDYIFITKHTLMPHPDDGQLFLNLLSSVRFFEYDSDLDDFYLSESIKESDLQDRLIEFNADLVLFKIKKHEISKRKRIKVTDDGVKDCTAYAMTLANPSTLLALKLERSVQKQRRYTLANWEGSELLIGCSGSAIIANDAPLLQGFIKQHPTKEFSGKYIDAVKISFHEINSILRHKGLETLEIDKKSKINRIVANSIIVDLREAVINGVKINLLQATKQIEVDCEDDWFHDSLSYVDLRSTDFLFNYFQNYFTGKKYKTQIAEKFFLPKSSFTLRKALLIHYTDRLFYTALVSVIGGSIESNLLPVVYSARFNHSSEGSLIISGVEQWKKMMYQIHTYSEEYNYVIEIDILNFFDNIHTDLLSDKLLTICHSANERNAVKELRIILSSFSGESKNGIPQNNDASSLLATFYLNEIDTYMIHQVPKYLRFMDDIKVFCHDEFEARRYLRLIEIKLRDLELSLNSQKTKIINLKPTVSKEKTKIVKAYQSFFDLERSKLSKLWSSKSYINKNEAFHLAIKCLKLNLKSNSSVYKKTNERSIIQALSVLKKGKIRGVSFKKYKGDISDILEELPELLKSHPWMTPQIVYLIAIIDIHLIPESIWSEIAEIVTTDKYNTYSWQCYHLWLLLGKHKIQSPELSKYASQFLDSNDNSNRPVVAALMIYMASIDPDYRRIILNKFKHGFTNGEFQRRAALVTLRHFHTEDVCSGGDDSAFHQSLHKHKDKELIFINGESNEDYSELIQMYSL